MNAPAPHRTTRRLRLLRHATAATAAAGLALTAFTPTAATAAPRPDAVQQRLDALVRADGVPAALATVKGRDGRD
ncbi:serine hydrolase, partial [Kitasatospora cineracea]